MFDPSIKEKFDKVIAYSQGINHPITDEIFAKWETNKDWFIQKMPNLIWTSPNEITIDISEEKKRSQVHDFCMMIADDYNYVQLTDFIWANRDSFYDNVVVDNKKCSEAVLGMKLIKAFKFFILDEDDLKYLQDKASTLIQSAKIKGYLNLSVHPLDYLSSSENAHNWRSCHALNGDYGAGNLSYMCDPSTVIAYLSDKKEYNLPNFPTDVKWNSKRWRTLIHFSDDKDMIFFGNAYPFQNDGLKEHIAKIDIPAVFGSRYEYGTPSKEFISMTGTNRLYPVSANRALSIEKIVKSEPDTLEYNDLLYSSTHIPQYSFRYGDIPLSRENSKVRIGGAVPCVCCGRRNIRRAETFMFCDECGS